MSLLFTTCSDPGVIPQPLPYSNMSDFDGDLEQTNASKSLLLAKNQTKQKNKAKQTHDVKNDDLEAALNGSSDPTTNENSDGIEEEEKK